MYKGFVERGIAGEIFSSALSSIQSVLGRFSSVFGAIFLIGFVALTLVYAAVQPKFSWDMIAYLASSKALEEGVTPGTIHADSFAAVKDATDPETYKNLAEGDNYRLRQSTDPEAFHSMLPMYKVKYLYVLAVDQLAPVFGGLKAMHVMSLVSAAMIGCIFFAWLSSAKALALSPLIVGLLVFTQFPELSLNGGPDIVQSAFLVAGAYIYWRFENPFAAIMAIACLVVGFGMRPDLLVVLFGLVLAVIFLGGRVMVPLVSFAVSAAVYPFITEAGAHPGWWTHFMFSLVTYSETLVGFDPDFSITMYVRSLVRGLTFGLVQQSWLVLTLIALGARLMIWRSNIQIDRAANVLFWGCLIGVIGKFVVFPIPDTRTYIAPLLVLYLALILGLKNYFLRENPQLTD